VERERIDAVDEIERRPPDRQPAMERTPPAAVLALQRTHGNAAVQRMLAARAPVIARSPAPEAPAAEAKPAAPAADYDTLVKEITDAIAEHKSATDAIKGKKKPTKEEKKAVADAKSRHQTGVVRLAAFLRSEMPPKDVLDSYLDRPDVKADEKVQTLGDLAAEVARMEFLLGTMHHMGTSEKWEGAGANKGAFPSEYQKTVGGGSDAPWCTKFAGYAYERIGFQAGEKDDSSMFYSGYRLREWSKTGKDIGGKQVTKAEEAVGAEGSSGALIDKGEWKTLRKSLEKAKTDDDRRKVTEEFFKTHPEPRSGDTIVKPRGSQKDNEFTGGKSHTMLVDSFDASDFVIYTVEGNAGDKVGARKLDLKKADDVGSIIFLTRLGTEYFGDKSTSMSEAPGLFGQIMYSREMLVGTMRLVNKALVDINAAQGWIKSSDAGASVYEWIHGSTDDGGGGVKET
jgi:hypothetical protein